MDEAPPMAKYHFAGASNIPLWLRSMERHERAYLEPR